MKTKADNAELKRRSNQVRKLILQMIYLAGSGHPGGSLSAAELITYLFFCELRLRVGDPHWAERDRFVLSKGHACPALYAVAAEVGLVEKDLLRTLRKFGSRLQGHPDAGWASWVEASTGSLGQGFSAAVGMALGLRFGKREGRVYVMLGDGELQEGEVWEGAMFAAHRRLDNLCAIIDYNRMQSDDLNENVIGLEPLHLKWEAFNWQTREINGHDYRQIGEALEFARGVTGRPTVIIARTVKGRGVSFMEGSPDWHGSVKLRREEIEMALGDLNTTPAEITELIGNGESS